MLVRSLLAAAVALAGAPAFAQSNASGLDRSNFDATTAACTDFYQHANGSWLTHNPVPAAYSSWGTFNELDQRNNTKLREIAREAMAVRTIAAGSPQVLVGSFYAAALDEATIERLDATPIAADVKSIERLRKRADVVALIRQWHARGTPVLFGLGVRQDLKDTSRIIAYATQGGLGLPNRDYYTRTDADSVTLREQYLAHIARMLELSGVKQKNARKQANAVLALETRLANAALPREELRDPNNSYNVVTFDAANTVTPAFDWRMFFDAIGVVGAKDFSLSHPAFFATMQRELEKTSVKDWQAYLRWNLVNGAAANLSSRFVDADFAFSGTVLRGQKALKPRDERTVDQMNSLLGDPLGQLFVARYFPPQAKARMMTMIGNLKTALRARLEQLPWMGEATRAQAIEKWSTFTPKIGYTEVWKDYRGVALLRDAHFANVRRLQQHLTQLNLAKIGKPVDRREWGMPPQQVNAYYNATWNEIVFPAGILQPPFFDMSADDALNYGAIGAVIGHELLHGFDDSGSRFDAQGRLNMWWTANDRKEFEARADKLVTQAGEFEALPGLKLNGRVSLGENIGDLGGVTMAYGALELALKERPLLQIDGLTPQQRFFHGWAQIWRRSYTDEALKIQVNVGPHSPGKFRVNGPFANLDSFAEAFGCKAGDAMVRADATRVQIW
ncbi:MAG TPA: M13 family metallopeptidase [Pseudomonadota bacterium]|nr:M13 family metallopeptidase [Xanthomonadales bacterium]HQW80725.1 M13 family metallopeptidase [Pseudomonadota bacterium]